VTKHSSSTADATAVTLTAAISAGTLAGVGPAERLSVSIEAPTKVESNIATRSNDAVIVARPSAWVIKGEKI